MGKFKESTVQDCKMKDSYSRFVNLEKRVRKNEAVFERLSELGLWVWGTGIFHIKLLEKKREKRKKKEQERKGKDN